MSSIEFGLFVIEVAAITTVIVVLLGLLVYGIISIIGDAIRPRRPLNLKKEYKPHRIFEPSED